MGKLPGVLSLPRMVRHLDATGEGLPVDDDVRFDAPDPRVEEVCGMARRGLFDPAKALLATAREQADRRLRGEAARALGEVALTGPAWLESWIAHAPDDPDLLLVRAESAIARAWSIRTAARASDVTAGQFGGFRAVLCDSLPVLERAVERNPGDPAPWVTMLHHDRGTAASRQLFEGHLRKALEHDPYNWSAHAAAVQFLAAKWYGSHEEMLAFAEHAAAGSPAGNPLRGLPVVALSELILDKTLAAKKGLERYGSIGRDRVDAAIAAALELSASYPAGEPLVALVRNHLAWALIRDGRPAGEILGAFRAIGTRATSHPWTYLGVGQSAFFTFRTGARAQMARETPFFRGAVPGAGANSGAVEGASPGRTAAGGRYELGFVPAQIAEVVDAVSLTGVTYRMAPLVRAGFTLVEVAPSQEPERKRGERSGLRRTLLGEGDLVRLAASFTAAQPWPVLVVSRFSGRYGIILVRKREIVTAHDWRGAEGIPTREEAVEVAAALVGAFPKGDVRQITFALRDPDEGLAPLIATLAALRLPALPEGYGEEHEVLRGAPQVRLVEKRSLMSALLGFTRHSSPGDKPLEIPPLDK